MFSAFIHIFTPDPAADNSELADRIVGEVDAHRARPAVSRCEPLESPEERRKRMAWERAE